MGCESGRGERAAVPAPAGPHRSERKTKANDYRPIPARWRVNCPPMPRIMRTDEKMKRALRWACALALFTIAAPMVSAQALLTVAESSGYKATSKHAQVIEYCERL